MNKVKNLDKLKKDDRRKKSDIWSGWIRYSGLIIWLILIPVLMVTCDAKPQEDNFFNVFFATPARKKWDVGVLENCMYILAAISILSFISIIINYRRMKRRTDMINKNLIVSAFLSFAVAVIIYIFIY